MEGKPSAKERCDWRQRRTGPVQPGDVLRERARDGWLARKRGTELQGWKRSISDLGARDVGKAHQFRSGAEVQSQSQSCGTSVIPPRSRSEENLGALVNSVLLQPGNEQPDEAPANATHQLQSPRAKEGATHLDSVNISISTATIESPLQTRRRELKTAPRRFLRLDSCAVLAAQKSMLSVKSGAVTRNRRASIAARRQLCLRARRRRKDGPRASSFLRVLM